MLVALELIGCDIGHVCARHGTGDDDRGRRGLVAERFFAEDVAQLVGIAHGFELADLPIERQVLNVQGLEYNRRTAAFETLHPLRICGSQIDRVDHCTDDKRRLQNSELQRRPKGDKEHKPKGQ